MANSSTGTTLHAYNGRKSSRIVVDAVFREIGNNMHENKMVLFSVAVFSVLLHKKIAHGTVGI
jgi:hypothetical protein